jgi:hypothetical protein
MLAWLLTRVLHPNGERSAAAVTAAHRGASIDAAVAWWVEALRGRDGVDEPALEAFAAGLAAGLSAKLETVHRVYLEVDHLPRGVLRGAAEPAGLLHAPFPHGTTMAVTDGQVEVAAGYRAPYLAVGPG